MKTTISIALVAASLALATSASAHVFDRATTASVFSDRSLNTAAANDAGPTRIDGRFSVAASATASGGPSGGPGQNGG